MSRYDTHSYTQLAAPAAPAAPAASADLTAPAAPAARLVYFAACFTASSSASVFASGVSGVKVLQNYVHLLCLRV